MAKWQVTTIDLGIKTDLGTYDGKTKDDVIQQVLKAKPFFDDWTYEEQLNFIHEIKA